MSIISGASSSDDGVINLNATANPLTLRELIDRVTSIHLELYPNQQVGTFTTLHCANKSIDIRSISAISQRRDLLHIINGMLGNLPKGMKEAAYKYEKETSPDQVGVEKKNTKIWLVLMLCRQDNNEREMDPFYIHYTQDGLTENSSPSPIINEASIVMERHTGDDLPLENKNSSTCGDSPSGIINNASIAEPSPSVAAADSQRCVVNGVPMVWNTHIHQWLPDVEVNEDFIAQYNTTYGVQYDYSALNPNPGASSTSDAKLPTEKKLTKEEKEARKREAAERSKNWIDIEDDKNTTVYVSKLPSTITDEEFFDFMSKCGVIMKDPRTGKPKIKLYRNETGDIKRDGTCCYIKMESVELAMKILDGWNLNGSNVHVEKAKFELKGEYDPSKKKRRLTAAQKKKYFERQQKIFDWTPEKPRSYRPYCECTVVFKNMFSLETIDSDPSSILKLKSDIENLCARFGSVKKVTVYDSHPEGVITVFFETVEHSDSAISMLNGRLFAGRVVSAAHWDGKTKFKKVETQEERERRDSAWEKFLGKDEDHE